MTPRGWRCSPPRQGLLDLRGQVVWRLWAPLPLLGHHPLEDRHFAEIGRLDIVMVPVDGGLTLSHAGMTTIAQRLQSSLLLPMHRRGAPISSFIEMMGDKFATDFVSDDRFTVSARSLPRRPTILILKGV